MAIAAAMQSAAVRLVGTKPTTLFGSSGQLEVELCDLVNEVAEICLATHDWQALTKLHTITGDGSTTAFDLPDDYERQLLRSDVQDLDSWAWGYCHLTDINEFAYQQEHGFGPFPGAWTIYQNKMHFAPAPLATATFPYISNLFALDSATLSGKEAFSSDTDAFVLPERLLTLGLVWKWREQKKLDFTGDEMAFKAALSQYSAKDAGSRIIRSGRRRFLRGTQVAWPYELGPA